MALDLLQICPYDKAPFRDICRSHAAAAESLGWTSHTVFLHSPDRRQQFSPVEDNRYYMDGPEDPAGLHHLRNLAPRKLCIMHRYRSMRVARRAGLKAPQEVLLAHEFGLLASRWRRLRLKLFERKLLLAGVSPAVAEGLGTSLVLPNALDAAEQDQHRFPRAVARQHLGVAGDELVVGVLGRLHRKKNTSLAMEGFAEFQRSFDKPARLLVMGDGPLRPRLEEKAAELKLPATFAGFVANATRYLQAFDILLFPAASTEAFGMVALEAMLAEVPVVSSRAAGPSWVLGERAAYFEGDNVASVADALHEAVRERVVGRDRALQEFSIEATAKRLRELAQA